MKLFAGPMKRMVVLTIVLGLILSTSASAQSPWLNPDPAPSVSLEIVKPDLYLSDYWKINFTSSVWTLSARMPLAENVHGLVDFGFVLYKEKYEYGAGMETFDGRSGNTVTNPFLGVEVLDPNRRWYLQMGLRLPVVTDPTINNQAGRQYGMLTDIHRMEAFANDVFPFRLRFGDRVRTDNMTFHVYMGPSFWFFTGSNSGEDTEVWLDYGGQVWVSSEVARVGGGFVGRYWLTADEGNFNERSLHQFRFSANFARGIVRPGVQLRVPLDDNWEMTGVKYIWGLYINVLTE